MPRRRYTAEQKAQAVGVAVADGVTRASEVTGIPKQTIDYWQSKPEYGHLRTTARETVAEQFWTGIQVGLRVVIQGLEGDSPLKEKAAALAVLYDRFALLTGSATSRSESRDISGTISDAELTAAVREAQALVGAGHPRVAEEAEGTPEG